MMHCIVTSSEEITKYKDLRSITLPSSSGKMQVLSGHAEAFLLLERGNIILDFAKEKKKTFEIASGECHIKNNNLVVIL